MGNCGLFGCVTVDQGSVGILETFGKYSRNLSPGCHGIFPCIQSLQYVFDMRQQQLLIKVDTKTHDNVFCTVEIAIFYAFKAQEIQSFAYEITGYQDMITSVVQDQVRSILCKISLDESFETKQEMTGIIKEELIKEFGHFGINFISVIVNDIIPDMKVKEAMNEINRQARLRIAVESEAEARKIQSIKAAEAEAEAKKLSGVGLAEQRKAIVDGLTSSISNFVDHVDIQPQQVMQIVMMNQYFDTLKELTSQSKSNCVFLPQNPSTSTELNQQIMSAALLSNNSHRGKQPQPLNSIPQNDLLSKSHVDNNIKFH